jgi:hypothetical protein
MTCPPNRCTVPIMNSSLSRRPSQARWRVSCRSPWPGDRRIPRATRQVRGHHRIVVIRRTGTTLDGMGSRRHPTYTDGRWSARVLSELAGQRGCLRCSPSRSPAAAAAAAPGRRASRGPRYSRALATSAGRYPRRGTCKDGFTIAGTSRHVQDRSCRAVTASRHSGALCGPRRCGHRSRCVQWPIRRSPMPLPEPPGKGAPRSHSANRGAVPRSAFRESGTVTGPGSRGSPVNHLDQTRTAHQSGQQTAKTVSASTADAESG